MSDKIKPASKSKEKVSYSKRVRKGNTSKEITVREVENGFVIDVFTSTDDPKKGYSYEERTYISTTNPLIPKKVDEEFDLEEFGDLQFNL